MQNTSNSIRNGSVFNVSSMTKQIKIQDENHQTNTTIKDNSNSLGASTSLKGKLSNLQDSINGIAEELKDHRKNFFELFERKDKIKHFIVLKADTVKKSLKEEVEKVEKEMERNFSHQKAENSRLQQQISQLKSEKITVQNMLAALQRRITDIELQIGDNK